MTSSHGCSPPKQVEYHWTSHVVAVRKLCMCPFQAGFKVLCRLCQYAGANEDLLKNNFQKDGRTCLFDRMVNACMNVRRDANSCGRLHTSSKKFEHVVSGCEVPMLLQAKLSVVY